MIGVQIVRPEDQIMRGTLKFFAAALVACFVGSTSAQALLADYSGTFDVRFDPPGPGGDSLLGTLPFSPGGGGLDGGPLFAGNIFWNMYIIGNQIQIVMVDTGCCTSPADFSGPVVTFNSFFDVFFEIELTGTNIDGMDQSRVGWDNDTITLNVQGGLNLLPENQVGKYVYLQATYTTIPAPGALALLGLGLLGIGAARRRR